MLTLLVLAITASGVFAAGSENTGCANRKEIRMLNIRPLADDFVKLFESPDPENVSFT